MLFSRMEDFLEKNIEGFFNRKFSSSLQIAEIEKILERLLVRHKKQINRAFFIPDAFTITMSESDYRSLNKFETIAKLKLFLYKTTIQKDYFMAKKPVLNILKDSGLKLGVCDVKAAFAGKLTQKELSKDDSSEKNSEINNTGKIEEGTIIVPSSGIKEFTESAKAAQNLKFASLTVSSGPDKDSFLAIGEDQIHIGRRDKNEFILTDVNVSRLHAYISFKNGRHIIHDADSLNGTKVNKQRIRSFCLCTGDEIQIGNTTVIYKVL